MKKIIKFVTIISISFSTLVVNTYANEEIQTDLNIDNVVAEVTVTYDDTGETEVFYTEATTTAEPITSRSNTGELIQSVTANCDVFIQLGEDKTPIVRNTNQGSNTTYGGIRATLNVNFDFNSTNDKIRVNRVWGSWTPTSNVYYVSNRYYMVHSGTLVGRKYESRPTSNSFSYTTGWGYNDRVGSSFAPRAISECKGNISGMQSQATISINFTFGGF